ncbi:MAG: DUF1801 domain-containing protein [Bacteroidia bacterium]
MAKIKHVENAPELISDAIENAPPLAKPILKKLRELIHKAEPKIIEDWKWGPNFYKDGMVCGIWGFKGHTSMVFFNGSSMKDPLKLFNYGESNSHNRTIKFTDVKQVNDKAIIRYVKESVAVNSKGERKDLKKTAIPTKFKKILVKSKLLGIFEKQSFTARKEMIVGITSAKQEATIRKRIEKALELLKSKA